MDQYLGMIFTMGFNFAPRGYALCAGQLIAISSNTALFSILGVNYGGNGTSNFALPDLQGRGAVSQGQSPGNSDYVVGEATGEEIVSVLQVNMPIHNHLMNGNAAPGNQTTPAGYILGEGPKTGIGPGAKSDNFYNNVAPNTVMNPLSLSLTGSNIPMSIMQPYLAVTMAIATTGIFPARN